MMYLKDTWLLFPPDIRENPANIFDTKKLKVWFLYYEKVYWTFGPLNPILIIFFIEIILHFGSTNNIYLANPNHEFTKDKTILILIKGSWK